MSVIEALTEEQCTIISRAENAKYPLSKSIADIDLIADLAELKIKLRHESRKEQANA